MVLLLGQLLYPSVYGGRIPAVFGGRTVAIRRGMSDYRQAGAGGIIFMGLLQSLTFPMSYEQRKILYRGLYSAIVAKVEVDKKAKEDKHIGTLIGATKLLIDQAGTDYKAYFESKETHSELENNYTELLAQILDKHWEIAVKANLIETVTDDGVNMA